MEMRGRERFDMNKPRRRVIERALFSDCGTYRYILRRSIPCPVRWVKEVVFIMLNPSTADANKDDPTIRRCTNFARDWCCTRLTVVNLFALRATDPKDLTRHPDPVGPDNDKHLKAEIKKHRIVVAAWGGSSLARKQWIHYRHGILRRLDICLGVLGTTKSGAPRHPLYLKKDLEVVAWEDGSYLEGNARHPMD